MKKGSHHSKESIQKDRLANSGKNNPMYGKTNEKCPNWKGNKASRKAIHNWVRERKSKPDTCEICNKEEPIDLANISGNYQRDVTDFFWLCRRCHSRLDNNHIFLRNIESKNNKTKTKLEKNTWRIQRREALRRDNYTCQICRDKQEKSLLNGSIKKELSIHHILSLKNGGTNDLSNLLTVCASCHHSIEPKSKAMFSQPKLPDEKRDVT